MRFQVGDIVRLAKDGWYYQHSDESNPKDMNGRITEIDLSIIVDWDNGHASTYYECDLKLRRRD